MLLSQNIYDVKKRVVKHVNLVIKKIHFFTQIDRNGKNNSELSL